MLHLHWCSDIVPCVEGGKNWNAYRQVASWNPWMSVTLEPWKREYCFVATVTIGNPLSVGIQCLSVKKKKKGEKKGCVFVMLNYSV